MDIDEVLKAVGTVQRVHGGLSMLDQRWWKPLIVPGVALLGITGFALLASGAQASTYTGPPIDFVGNGIRERAAVQLLSRYAQQAGVDPATVVMWADLESGLRSDAIGDRSWPNRLFRGGPKTMWMQHVRDNPVFANNPFRNDVGAWVSYGWFQFLSPYWLARTGDANAHPSVLLRPDVSGPLGASYVKRLLSEHNGNLFLARLAAACGRPSACSESTIRGSYGRVVAKAREHGVRLPSTSVEDIIRMARA